MTRIVINGKKINVPKDYTVFQACQKMGLEIPHFCFHERLSIAGNCRMCLVQQKGVRHPIASCAVPVSEGMEIDTTSEVAKKARAGVMEFLLINHPLDCPICDQGGECDLQDQAMAYGRSYGRFEEQKRAVADKNMGPLVQTYMTRCIHCTRCVRFATEVAGVEEIGALGRGEDTEIINYVEGALESELSGNIIDLCPVGALTSKPYAGTARSWELESTESVDVLDAVGSNICVDTRAGKVMRILPRTCEEVNEEWISDKTRFAYDGLALQRLDTPWLRNEAGRLVPVDWQTAIHKLTTVLKNTAPKKVGAVSGDLCCAESMFALLSLLKALGANSLDCRQDGARLDANLRQRYLFNTTIQGIQDADACLLVGTNPRLEAPIINARLRKRWKEGAMPAWRLAAPYPLGWEPQELGQDPNTLTAIASGKHPVAQKLRRAKNPMLIVGQNALARQDGDGILRLCLHIAQNFTKPTAQNIPAKGVNAGGGASADGAASGEGWNGFNVLHRAAARVAGLDMGFVPSKGGFAAWQMVRAFAQHKLEVLWLLGADELDFSPLRHHQAETSETSETSGANGTNGTSLNGDAYGANAQSDKSQGDKSQRDKSQSDKSHRSNKGNPPRGFIVYQGHHGDRGAEVADLILPAKAYTEKAGSYINTEGRLQRGLAAATPPENALNEWEVIGEVAARLKLAVGFSDLASLHTKMAQANPVLVEEGIATTGWRSEATAMPQAKLSPAPLEGFDGNFYQTDAITRSSPTMAKCYGAKSNGAKTLGVKSNGAKSNGAKRSD